MVGFGFLGLVVVVMVLGDGKEALKNLTLFSAAMNAVTA